MFFVAGWHAPTDAEWTILGTFLGGDPVAGNKLKEAGDVHWSLPHTDATNEIGFTALPGGCRRGDNGGFNDWSIGTECHFWSATEVTSSDAYLRMFMSTWNDLYVTNAEKAVGTSIRLVKD